MKQEFNEISIVVCPASEQHPRLDEASLIPFDDGRLYLAYSDFYGGNEEDEGAARIMGKWSPNEGVIWSEPFVVAENTGKVNVMEPSLLRLPSGRILRTFMPQDRDHLDPRGEELILMIEHYDNLDSYRSENKPQRTLIQQKAEI